MSALAEAEDRMAQLAQPLQFCLLGTLIVRDGRTVVPVAAAKQRVVLAALLLSADRAVPLDELADAVWGAKPPASARVTLHNYVKRLRAALGDAGHTRIATRPQGYQINIGDGELDLARFEGLRRRARRAALREAWEESAALLRSALELWRGQPLSDVPSERLLREQPRLLEMHVQAQEARIDADLHVGRHAEVISDLHQLTAAHPLRERLHGMLMLALYRDGRQAEALAVYRRARRALVSELGVEPGPGLSGLHQQILAGGRDLLNKRPPIGDQPSEAATARTQRLRITGSGPSAGQPADRHTPGPPASSPVAPRQLPMSVRHFAGRKAELKALSQLLDEAGTVVISAIGGTAGIGKTALAVHFAHQVADRFPDGQIHVNLRGFDLTGTPVKPAEAIRGFLDALGVPAGQIPASLDSQAGLYRSLLAGKRMLILLDNARDTDHVRPLLPGSPGCLVLVTSRCQLSGLVAQGAHALTLDVLTGAEARELLVRRLGAERVTAEPTAASELSGLCARLPLALSITAARAAAHPGFPLAGLAAELRDARGRLDAFNMGEPGADARAIFSWSYQRLDEPAARMFRLLGLHPGPDTTAAAAASLAGITLCEARRALSRLTAASLLIEHSLGRYAFHDLLRAYAAEQASAIDDDTERHAAIHRIAEHYLHSACAGQRLLYPMRQPVSVRPPQARIQPEPFASHAQALAWFDAEHQVLLATASMAASHGLEACAWRLAWAMETFLYRREHWHDWAATQDIALAAALSIGEIEGQASAHRGIGCASIELGAFDDARRHLAAALRLYRQSGDWNGQARIQEDLSRACSRQGRHAEALRHGQEALAAFRAIGDRVGEAAALSNLGWDLSQVGDYVQALAYCEEALKLHRELGNQHYEGTAWDSLGYAHRCLGHHAQAAECYRRAVEILDQQGHTYHKAETLTYAGDAHRAAGNVTAAREAWEEALTILDQVRHPDAAAVRAKLAALSAMP